MELLLEIRGDWLIVEVYALLGAKLMGPFGIVHSLT